MKKTKKHYIESVSPKCERMTWYLYPNMRDDHYRRFSFRQECSYYLMHLLEQKEYPLKLRSARGAQLMDVFWGRRSFCQSLSESWKHNSKRRSQNYR